MTTELADSVKFLANTLADEAQLRDSKKLLNFLGKLDSISHNPSSIFNGSSASAEPNTTTISSPAPAA